MASPSESRKSATVIGILTKQYGAFRKEAQRISKEFNSQVRYVQLSAALMLGLASAATADKLKILNDVAASSTVWQLGAFSLSTFVYYLFWRIIVNRYEMISISIALSMCERQINAQLGVQVLAWNSIVVPKIWSPRGIGLSFPPSLGVAIYAFLLALAVATVVPVLIYLRYYPAGIPLEIVSCLAIAYTVLSPIIIAISLGQMMRSGWKKANSFVARLVEPASASSQIQD